MLIVTVVKPPHPIFACDFSHISFSETWKAFPLLQILECKLLLLFIFAHFLLEWLDLRVRAANCSNSNYSPEQLKEAQGCGKI